MSVTTRSTGREEVSGKPHFWTILDFPFAACCMATMTLSTDEAVPSGPLSSRLSTVQVWGFVLLAPYVLVFLAFVLYPVGYGLWLARHPASYVELWHDPIFARSAANSGGASTRFRSSRWGSPASPTPIAGPFRSGRDRTRWRSPP